MGKHYLRSTYHAPQGRNGSCTVYRSPKLAALVAQHFAASTQAPTVVGVGSVSHATQPIPNAYTVGACSSHGQVVGNGNALCGGLTKGVGFVPPYVACMGYCPTRPMGNNALVYCTQCRAWVLALGHQLYVPKPAAPVLTATQQAAKAANPQLKPVSYTVQANMRPGGNGNVFAGAKYTAH